MRFSLYVSCLLISVCAFALSAHADTTDVNALLNEKLKQHGQVLISTSTSRRCVKEEQRCSEYSDRSRRCLGAYKECVAWATNTHEHRGYLTAAEIDVKVIDESYGKEVLAGIPDRILVKKTTAKNCTSTTQNNSGTLSLTASHTKSISITKGISSSKNIAVKIGARFGAFNSGASVSLAKTVSLNASNTTSDTSAASYTESFQRRVEPMTAISTRLKIIERTMMIPYTAKVLVDASLQPNMAGLKKASDILSKADRTIEVTGELTADLASQAFLDYNETKLTPEDCSDNKSNKLEKTDSEQKMYDVKSIPKPAGFFKKQKKNKILSYIATGSHQCQSHESIGHSCEVFGSMYDDCISAQVDLAGEDCCFATPEGGNSIGFSLDYCAPF
ncbi:MAG: hypothetical protein K6L80_01125 [Agarilytica sp.]